MPSRQATIRGAAISNIKPRVDYEASMFVQKWGAAWRRLRAVLRLPLLTLNIVASRSRLATTVDDP